MGCGDTANAATAASAWALNCTDFNAREAIIAASLWALQQGGGSSVNRATTSTSQTVTGTGTQTPTATAAANLLRTAVQLQNIGTTVVYYFKGLGCSNVAGNYTGVLAADAGPAQGYGGTEFIVGSQYNGPISLWCAGTMSVVVGVDTLA
jgi:hypothetical protein